MNLLLSAKTTSDGDNILWIVILVLLVYCIVSMVITARYSCKIKQKKKAIRLLSMTLTPAMLVMFYQSLIVGILALFALAITYNMVATIIQYRRLVAIADAENNKLYEATETVATCDETIVEPAPDVASEQQIVDTNDNVADENSMINSDDGMNDDNEEDSFLAGKNKRYILSFVAKISQLSPETKGYYNTLKNALMAHDRVRDRQSWCYDSISVGRNVIARFAIRGKTLKFYLALNADDYVETKYKVVKVESKKYQKTPCLYKIINPRREKYALQLIDQLVERYSLKKIDAEPTDYVAKYPRLIKEA